MLLKAVVHFPRTPRCLGHVVNLGTIDVMGHITKIAAVETTTAIWEYDPDLPGNRVLGGSLDVIAAIHTLAIKVSQWRAFLCGTFTYVSIDPMLRTAYRILSKASS